MQYIRDELLIVGKSSLITGAHMLQAGDMVKHHKELIFFLL